MESSGTPDRIVRAMSAMVPFPCRHVPDRNVGPLTVPLPPRPWHRLQLRALKSESPTATSRAVKPGGSVESGEDVDTEARWHAAPKLTATNS
jgi:hypothetical protein